jgi:hypothetical protein
VIPSGPTLGFVLPYLPYSTRRRHPAGVATVAVLADAIAKATPSLTPEQRQREFLTLAVGVALHEAVHVVANGWADRPAPSAERVQAWRALLETDPPPTTARVPWAWHGPQFIRLCLHVQRRAERAGWHCVIHDPASQSLSSWRAYAAALSHELDSNERTLSDILATPLPAAFVRRFRADVFDWIRSQPDPPAARRLVAKHGGICDPMADSVRSAALRERCRFDRTLFFTGPCCTAPWYRPIY